MLDYKEYILPNILETSVIQEAIDFFTTRQMIDLSLTDTFSDAGVYALYYFGDFENYRPIAKINKKAKSLNKFFPIYVGKAVPKGSRTARTKTSIEQTLFKRLEEHTKSIESAYPLHKGETFISGNRNIIRCVPLKKRCKLFSLNKS